jgi:hypothetical protein
MTTSAKAANCLERVSGNDPESRLWQSRVRPFSLYPQIVLVDVTGIEPVTFTVSR